LDGDIKNENWNDTQRGGLFCGLPIIFLKLQIFVNVIRKVRGKLWFLRKGEKYLPLSRIDQTTPPLSSP
jgi:hypothetical protein